MSTLRHTMVCGAPAADMPVGDQSARFRLRDGRHAQEPLSCVREIAREPVRRGMFQVESIGAGLFKTDESGEIVNPPLIEQVCYPARGGGERSTPESMGLRQRCALSTWTGMRPAPESPAASPPSADRPVAKVAHRAPVHRFGRVRPDRACLPAEAAGTGQVECMELPLARAKTGPPKCPNRPEFPVRRMPSSGPWPRTSARPEPAPFGGLTGPGDPASRCRFFTASGKNPEVDSVRPSDRQSPAGRGSAAGWVRPTSYRISARLNAKNAGGSARSWGQRRLVGVKFRVLVSKPRLVRSCSHVFTAVLAAGGSECGRPRQKGPAVAITKKSCQTASTPVVGCPTASWNIPQADCRNTQTMSRPMATSGHRLSVQATSPTADSTPRLASTPFSPVVREDPSPPTAQTSRQKKSVDSTPCRNII